MPLEISSIPGLDRVEAADWDHLVPASDPFTRHAFLAHLEESGSVGRGTGWLPCHLLVHEEEHLVGAAPVYLKNHSYGEYIFDWGWAQACARAGVPYYPKLVCAVPFTPATGGRLLARDGRNDVKTALAAGLRHLADETGAHSVHVLFCSPEDQQILTEAGAWIARLTQQFHWTNPGCTDFEDWLGRFQARDRKKARRERRRAEDAGVSIDVLQGPDLHAEHWASLERFYRDTVRRKHADAYLTPAFWAQGAERLSGLALGLFARTEPGAPPVAGALAFQAGTHLYGRYWGCLPNHHALHFELCYHRPIELSIQHGWSRFEAGAQGLHKLKRGLLPSATHSAHWLRHPGLADAVRQAITQETRMVQAEIEQLTEHGPFRKDGPS